MGRFGLAIKTFFRTLQDGEFADSIQQLLDGKALPAPESKTPETKEPKPVKQDAHKKKESKRSESKRNDALNLLATLQREARFVDFLQEDISVYSGDQVKAAVVDIHRDCAAVVERLFALQRMMKEEEEQTVEVPSGYDAARYRLTGKVSGEPPYTGILRHHGWEATKCDTPEWHGSEEAAWVVAAAEVEIE